MHTNTTPDQELIAAVLAGNQQAFAMLVDRYKAMVFSVAYRITNNREDAEELAQSAFIKAYRSLADYRHQARFSTWLYTIVQHLSLSFLRKRKLALADIEKPSVAQAMEQAGSQSGFAGIDHKSRQHILHQAMQHLAEDDAKVIGLFYQGEQTLEEIGQIMGIEPNNAKVKLHRARLRLKKILETKFAGEMPALING